MQRALDAPAEVEVARQLREVALGRSDPDVYPWRGRPSLEDIAQLGGPMGVSMALNDDGPELVRQPPTFFGIGEVALGEPHDLLGLACSRQRIAEQLSGPHHVVGDDERPGGEGIEHPRVDRAVRKRRGGGVIDDDRGVNVGRGQVAVRQGAARHAGHLGNRLPALPVDSDRAAVRHESRGDRLDNAARLAPAVRRKRHVDALDPLGAVATPEPDRVRGKRHQPGNVHARPVDQLLRSLARGEDDVEVLEPRLSDPTLGPVADPRDGDNA